LRFGGPLSIKAEKTLFCSKFREKHKNEFNMSKKILIGLLLTSTAFTLMSMKLFDFFKKKTESIKTISQSEPYRDSSTNLMYNLLFCDSLNLYKKNTPQPVSYPFDVLFSTTSTHSDLQKLIDDGQLPSRIRLLAYNKQTSSGNLPKKKEILAVILEVGLDDGLDVLATYQDGTARYINHTGKLIVWEKEDAKSKAITEAIFLSSQDIVKQIGVWDKPRRPFPTKGNMRLSLLVSDGIYFGEGPINDLFSDPLASPTLIKATELMQYLTEMSLKSGK
jgi:hypothetical protein